MSYGGEERIGLRISVDSTETKAAEKRVAELHRELDALGKQYEAGSLSSGQYLKATAALNRELEQTGKRLVASGDAAGIAQKDIELLRNTVHTTADGFGRGGMMVYQFGQAISDMSYGLAYGLNNISMIAAMMGVGGAFGIGIQFGIAGLEVLSRNWGNLTKAIDSNSDSLEANVKKLRDQGREQNNNLKLAKEFIELADKDIKRDEKAGSFPGPGENRNLDKLKQTVSTIGSKQSIGELAKMLLGSNRAADEAIAQEMATNWIGYLMGDNQAAAQRAASDIAGLGGIAGGSPATQFQRPLGAMFGRTELGAALKFGTPQERAKLQKEHEASRRQAEAMSAPDAFNLSLMAGAAGVGIAMMDRPMVTDAQVTQNMKAIDAKEKDRLKKVEQARKEAMQKQVEEDAQKRNEEIKAEAEALMQDPSFGGAAFGMANEVGLSPRAQQTIRRKMTQHMESQGIEGQRANAIMDVVLQQMLEIARAQGLQSQDNAIIRAKLQQIDAIIKLNEEAYRRASPTMQRMAR
jgi:hypothetical protein